MKLDDFNYHLPQELIAQFPLPERTASRMLCLNRENGSIADKQFKELPEYIKPNDLVIYNNTKVIPARLYATKETGGKAEILIERVLDDHTALAHIGASKSPKMGMQLFIDDNIALRVKERQDSLYVLETASDITIHDILNTAGHIPLPPYIDRSDNENDIDRYQTVYAKESGAVAAPTAGLHFDNNIMQAITDKGARIEYITLHVGAGTFQPVRAETIEEHQMHAEWLSVLKDLVNKIKDTKAKGGRIIAIGTSVVRALESAARTGELDAFNGDSRLFIYHGYSFKVVDALITNFHLPKSSLLMLVSAFAGYEHVQNAYQHAVEKAYRFFSYGDAMFIKK